MKLISIIFFFGYSFVLVFGQTPTTDANWQQTSVFFDDFYGTRYWNTNWRDNTNNWQAYFTETGIIHGPIPWMDRTEHQVYQKSNAVFDASGTLKLKSEYKQWDVNYEKPPVYYTNPSSYADPGPRAFFSGAIESVQSFKYGYFEIRCKLPQAYHGNFPAFWLWSYINDEYNEIDVFEHVIRPYNETTLPLHPEYDPIRIYSKYQRDGDQSPVAEYILQEGELPLTDWHTYAVEWAPHWAIFYFDGKQTCPAIFDTEIPIDAMRMKINLAIDNYIREYDTAVVRPFRYTYPSPAVVSNTFSREMIIDYVRVYKLKHQCQSSLSISSSYTLNNTPSMVRKEIAIGNSSVPIVVQNQEVSLRAVEEITINGDFEVPVGKSFYAVTHPCPEENVIPD